jgi:hypothetical protein
MVVLSFKLSVWIVTCNFGANTSLQFKHELQFMSSILLNVLRNPTIPELGDVSPIQKQFLIPLNYVKF